MQEIKLILELPVEGETDKSFPDPDLLPWQGTVGRASGLDGEQVLQLGVVLTAGTVRVLRTWLLARAEQRKHQRVVWNGRVFQGLTPEEIELVVRTLVRHLEQKPPAAS